MFARIVLLCEEPTVVFFLKKEVSVPLAENLQTCPEGEIYIHQRSCQEQMVFFLKFHIFIVSRDTELSITVLSV